MLARDWTRKVMAEPIVPKPIVPKRGAPKPGAPRLVEPGSLEEVPSRNIEILSDVLGVDVRSIDPEQMQAAVRTFSRSMSTSPYTSAEMLAEYRDRGFPDLPDRVIEAIDRQVAHRQALEVATSARHQARLDRAQLGAQVVAVLGLTGSLSIEGPNTATVASRLIDRMHG